MPIWLRNFTFNKIAEFKKKEKEAYDEASSKSSNKQTAIGPDGKINPSVFQRPTKSNYK